MIRRFLAWLRPPEQDDPATVLRKLGNKCNAEIVARLLRRAEIHEEHGGYPARCSPLDRDAARRMQGLMCALALHEGRSSTEVIDEIEKILALLREP